QVGGAVQFKVDKNGVITGNGSGITGLTASTVAPAAWASPGAIGSTAASTGAFTTLTSSGNLTDSGTLAVTSTSTLTGDVGVGGAPLAATGLNVASIAMGGSP